GESPEPGGGSAAALVGALGAALVGMVASLTLGKEKYAAVQEAVRQLKDEAAQLRRNLQELVTEDARAYAEVAAAMKLPQDTDENREKRSRVLQAALRRAAEVPLKVAEAAGEVARLSLTAAEIGNVHAVSDAGVAAVLAEAAAQSAALNVKINLAWIKDQEYNRQIWSRIEAVLSETNKLRDVVLAMTYEKIQ
ncbi:MAG: cyclodeaminase/cyclohydrolase family protein, partial [Thermoleophilia bacterium]|nr:cyclodeaminase/cyclohydrolase family protein [Thermoleophilia bacterium]